LEILITTNDSRLRLMSLSDYSVIRSFKGLKNSNFQIYGSFSDGGNYIICGSEDQQVFMWEVHDKKKNTLLGLGKSKTSASYHSFQAHAATVMATAFFPTRNRKSKFIEEQFIVTADASGILKIFENRAV
jgi:WD40 repeat protein